jgi:putative transposase
MIIKKAYKVRLYPNARQEKELLRILAGCRFVWNYFLERRTNDYLERKITTPYKVLAKELTGLHKTAPELVGLRRGATDQALRRLDATYTRFFKKLAELPHPKNSEDNRQSFQKAKDWVIKGNKIRIQRDLVIRTRGTLPSKAIKTGMLIVKREAGRWFASITVQEDVIFSGSHSHPIGVDVGLSSLAVTSDGKKFPTLKPSYQLHHQFKLLKQQLARQQIGSKRREKTRLALARVYQKMANIRDNHLHQSTHAVLLANPSLVALEDLNVKGMLQNGRLARSLSDVSLGEFQRQITYKQLWRGGRVVKIDRFYPSTKTCSKCGWVNENMTLATRDWTCLGCGVEHDRDINAARNILSQGMARVESSRELVEAQTI